MKKIALTLAAVAMTLGFPAVAAAEDCGTGYGDSCGYGHEEKGYDEEDSGYGGHDHGGYGDKGYAVRGGDGGGAHATGIAAGSPGVLSGNVIQVPIHVPVNVCGNTVNVIGLLNPAFGNTCVNA